jgi:bacterioferritin (cytochrome b1)
MDERLDRKNRRAVREAEAVKKQSAALAPAAPIVPLDAVDKAVAAKDVTPDMFDGMDDEDLKSVANEVAELWASMYGSALDAPKQAIAETKVDLPADQIQALRDRRKRTVVNDEALPAAKVYLVTNDGKAYGLLSMGAPRELSVDEFMAEDLSADEQAQRWPDANRLFCHDVLAYFDFGEPVDPSQVEYKAVSKMTREDLVKMAEKLHAEAEKRSLELGFPQDLQRQLQVAKSDSHPQSPDLYMPPNDPNPEAEPPFGQQPKEYASNKVKVPGVSDPIDGPKGHEWGSNNPAQQEWDAGDYSHYGEGDAGGFYEFSTSGGARYSAGAPNAGESPIASGSLAAAGKKNPIIARWRTTLTKAAVVPTVRMLLEARVHEAFTVTADYLYSVGLLERDERVSLSGLVGDLLDAFGGAMPYDLGVRPLNSVPQVETKVVTKGSAKTPPDIIMSVQSPVTVGPASASPEWGPTPVAKDGSLAAELNAALASEYGAWLTYVSCGHAASGLESDAVRNLFFDHADEEYEHAKLLGRKIVGLGVMPTIDVDLAVRGATLTTVPRSLAAMVALNLEMEHAATARYEQLLSRSDLDSALTNDLQTIASKEAEHAEELGRLCVEKDAQFIVGEPPQTEQDVRGGHFEGAPDDFAVTQACGTKYPFVMQHVFSGLRGQQERADLKKALDQVKAMAAGGDAAADAALADMWKKHDLKIITTNLEKLSASLQAADDGRGDASSVMASFLDSSPPQAIDLHKVLASVVTPGSVHTDLLIQSPEGDWLIGWMMDTPKSVLQTLDGKLLRVMRNKVLEHAPGDVVACQKTGRRETGNLHLVSPSSSVFKDESTNGQPVGEVRFLDRGEAIFGVQKPDYHEMFLSFEKNQKLSGRWEFKSAEPPDAWLAERPEVQAPYAVTHKDPEAGAAWNQAAVDLLREMKYPDMSDPAESVSKFVQVFKSASTEERTVFGVVLEPETMDAHGDVISISEIQNAAYTYMEFYQQKGFQHGKNPRYPAFPDGLRLLESYVLDPQLFPNGIDIGSRHVKPGTWLMRMRVDHDGLWSDIKTGRITGFSIGGFARSISEQRAA